MPEGRSVWVPATGKVCVECYRRPVLSSGLFVGDVFDESVRESWILLGLGWTILPLSMLNSVSWRFVKRAATYRPRTLPCFKYLPICHPVHQVQL